MFGCCLDIIQWSFWNDYNLHNSTICSFNFSPRFLRAVLAILQQRSQMTKHTLRGLIVSFIMQVFVIIALIISDVINDSSGLKQNTKLNKQVSFVCFSSKWCVFFPKPETSSVWLFLLEHVRYGLRNYLHELALFKELSICDFFFFRALFISLEGQILDAWHHNFPSKSNIFILGIRLFSKDQRRDTHTHTALKETNNMIPSGLQ